MGKSPPASFRKWRNYRPLEYSALEHCAGWKRFGRFPVSAYQQLGPQAETQYMVMAMFHSEGVYCIGSGVSTPRLLMTQPPEYTAGRVQPESRDRLISRLRWEKMEFLATCELKSPLGTALTRRRSNASVSGALALD